MAIQFDNHQQNIHALSSFDSLEGGTFDSKSSTQVTSGSILGLKHNHDISLDWTQEEQAILEQALVLFDSESLPKKYILIANKLKDKTVRDIALRVRWMSKKENGKRRKDDDDLIRNTRDKKLNNHKQNIHASSSFDSLRGGTLNSKSSTQVISGSILGLKHNHDISLDWTQEEQAILEQALVLFDSESLPKKYILIANKLKDKTVRDIALRVRWMSKKENGKKDDHDLIKNTRDKKERVFDPSVNSSHFASKTNRGISYKGLMHNLDISLDWTPEEQAILEQALVQFTDESPLRKYTLIANELKDKTVRDVALRVKWMGERVSNPSVNSSHFASQTNKGISYNGLKHNQDIYLDWTQEEQAILELTLKLFDDESPLKKYTIIANHLKDKTAQDVAMRVKWMGFE